MALLRNALYSSIFGLPLGYLVSRWGSGAMRGAMIGIGLGVLFVFVLAVLFGGPNTTSLQVIGLGAATGLIPGAIIGWHVGVDR